MENNVDFIIQKTYIKQSRKQRRKHMYIYGCVSVYWKETISETDNMI